MTRGLSAYRAHRTSDGGHHQHLYHCIILHGAPLTKNPQRYFDHGDHVALLDSALWHFAHFHPPERQMEHAYEHMICKGYVTHVCFWKQTWPFKGKKTCHTKTEVTPRGSDFRFFILRYLKRWHLFSMFSAGFHPWRSEARSLPNVWRRAVREKCPCHFGEGRLRPVVGSCFLPLHCFTTAAFFQDLELVFCDVEDVQNSPNGHKMP